MSGRARCEVCGRMMHWRGVLLGMVCDCEETVEGALWEAQRTEQDTWCGSDLNELLQ